MKIQKRVANYKLEKLIMERVPFTNYNNSIIAVIEDNFYSVSHWGTTIAIYDLDAKEVITFDFGMYSQTTSAVQGKVIRALFDQRARETMLDQLMGSNRKVAQRFGRMARLIR
jgi:hypothetical protein